MPSLVFEHANMAAKRHARHINFDTGCLTVEVSRTHTHTRTAGLLWMSDQLVAEATAYTTNNKTNIRALTGIQTCEPSDRAAGTTPQLGHRPSLCCGFYTHTV